MCLLVMIGVRDWRGGLSCFNARVKILILLAHPAPGSLNHAIAERVGDTLRAQGHEPDLLDLYASGFDPLLPPGEAARGLRCLLR